MAEWQGKKTSVWPHEKNPLQWLSEEFRFFFFPLLLNPLPFGFQWNMLVCEAVVTARTHWSGREEVSGLPVAAIY